ncbi:hypothetical protein DEO72_LG8g1364 [Vigna unguiculata]|uniref:Uncharacterized protein n=1 Tax=Vigna unguiculata TaxID=3917 RepID=A0A4D6MP88_VIGUN|nr:hypothetical protein DEO72_LG8g1364 [Vigna unguiculata]
MASRVVLRVHGGCSMMMVEEEGAATFVFANTAGDVREDGGTGNTQMKRWRSSWTVAESRWCGSGGSNRWQHDEVATFRREQRWLDVVLAAKGDVGGKRVMVKEKEIWNQLPPSYARGVPDGFGAELVREEDFYIAGGCSLVVEEVKWSVRDRGSYDEVSDDCPIQCINRLVGDELPPDDPFRSKPFRVPVVEPPAKFSVRFTDLRVAIVFRWRTCLAARSAAVAVRKARGMHPSGSGGAYGRRSELVMASRVVLRVHGGCSMMMVEEEGAATFVFANTGDVREDGGTGNTQMKRWRSSWTVAESRWCGSGGSNRWQHDEVATFRREQRWLDVVLAAKGDVGGKRVMVKEKEIWVRVLVV